ncbi:MAG: hypothetical protein Q8M29_07605 [Bacteroidota bacterium]|nr:hypothetical protein [Bacteroidota bacterium]
MAVIKIIIISLVCLVLGNCANEKHHSPESVNSFSRNIDTLKNYIDLKKYKPVNVMWKETRFDTKNSGRTIIPGPTDYKLEAYLQFDRSTADKLKNDYNVNSDSNNVISIDELWFGWLPKDMLHKDKLDSSKIDNADPFYKSPLLNGSYVFINANTILIELYTK